MLRKTVAYGAGKIFRDYMSMNIGKVFDYIVDANAELWDEEICGLKIYNPLALKSEDAVDIVVCTSPKYEIEIIENIELLKLKNYTVQLLGMPCFDQYNNGIAHGGYAAFCEDAVLDGYISYYRKKKIEHYIDIGANHPIRGNASIAFYLQGATGYLIEANPRYKHMYEILRNKDQVLICGCSSGEADGKSLTYYEVEGRDSWNTFSKERVQMYESKGYIVNRREIPMYSLNHIMQFCEFHIDYISIDVEGLEYSILKDFDFDKYQVQYFNVEKHGERIRELLERKKYKIFAETPSNWLFERQE